MKKQAKPTLENDFERMIPEYHKGSIIYGEHMVRYASAAKLVKGKVVLDIASGSGYGTKIIAKNAKKVIGVDVSEESVAYSKEYFGAKNIEYLTGDGEKIPLNAGSIDVVVSFETIEHIKDYKKFLAEIKRVLKPDGLLILSTPNDIEFAEGNHFHMHEFTLKELRGLVEKYFKHNESLYQGTWIYSALLNEESISDDGLIEVATYNHAPLSGDKYLYFFMLCSNRQITETIPSMGSISEHWSAKQIQEKENLTNQHIKNISDTLAATEHHAKELEAALESKEVYLQSVLAELNNINPALKVLKKISKVKSRIKRS